MKQRIYAIDFMRFIAVLFITNSHAIALYKDINPALATLGVHGNAIFLFVSGFTLALKDLKDTSFIDFYKRRLARIYPTLIMWPIMVNHYICYLSSMILGIYYGRLKIQSNRYS